MDPRYMHTARAHIWGALLAAWLLMAPASAAARTFLTSAHGGSLRSALEAIGGEPATLVVDADLTCDSPTLPANVELEVPRGVRVVLGAEPLEVLGTLSAGCYAVFSGEGRVTGLVDPRPEWFGARGDGSGDDTPAVQRAIDSVGAFPNGRMILAGRYAVSGLLVSHFGFTIRSDNAWLVALPGGGDSLLRFAPAAHSASITGNLSIDMGYHQDYGCAIQVNARYFTAHDVSIWRAALGWRIGDPKWATSGLPGDAERGDSEIVIYGGGTLHCLRAVEAVGANTIVRFAGSQLYSFPWTLPEGDARKAAWEAADATTIRAIGALVYLDGGGAANFANTPMIDVQPIATTDPAYFREYGKVFLTGTHIESGNYFTTSNPSGIDSAGRANSLSLIGCNGYLSSDNPVITTDPLFHGGIVVSHCGFYRAGRTSPIALIGNREATVSIDSDSFFDAAPKGLNAVWGGTQVFSDRLLLSVQGARQAIGAEPVTVRFLEADPTLPDGAPYASCYDPTTGAFTCPFGGLTGVRVRASVACADGEAADTYEVALVVGDRVVFRRTVLGYGAELDYTIPALAEGDRVFVRLRSGQPHRTDEGVGSCLQITASRHGPSGPFLPAPAPKP